MPPHHGFKHPSWILIFLLGVVSCFGVEPTLEGAPKIKSFTGGWGKATGSGSARQVSKLDGISPENLKKKADLASPVLVSVLSSGRSVDGLENIKERIIDVRISNPNPYPILFQGRQYKDNKTIKPGWNRLVQGKWTLAGWDWCGTGVRDWEIGPNSSIDVMLYLHPELQKQQILGRFYKSDDPSIQTVCLLYEKK